MVTDPVCEMQFDAPEAAATRDYKGRTYYFCSLSCRDAFDKEPEKYAASEQGDSAKA